MTALASKAYPLHHSDQWFPICGRDMTMFLHKFAPTSLRPFRGQQQPSDLGIPGGFCPFPLIPLGNSAWSEPCRGWEMACFLVLSDPGFLAVLLTGWCQCLLFERPCVWLFGRAMWLLALPIEADLSLPFCCRILCLSSLFTPTTTQLVWWKWDVKMPQASVAYPVSFKKLWLPPEIFVPSSNWLFLLLTFRQLQQVSLRLTKDSLKKNHLFI